MIFHLHVGLSFASGGADKVVIIWTSDPPDGQLKYMYTHSDSVQCISYNPVSPQLVNYTAPEVGKSRSYNCMCTLWNMFIVSTT